jgi:hypothetical protein
MAEVIDVNQMLAKTYEPKRQFRWILEVDGLDSFVMQSTSRPKGNFGEVQMDWLNDRWWLAGKWTWDPMDLVLRDPIAPSAAQKVMDWVRLCYEHETGRAGYAAFYKKDIVLKLLDGPGAVVERWVIKGAWLQNIDMGSLSYTEDAPTEITCTMRYDKATLEY